MGIRRGWPWSSTSAWPAEPSGPNVYYVAKGNAIGSGTQSDPFGSLTDAYAQVPDQSILVLGPGRYQPGLVQDRALSFVGTCVEEVQLDPVHRNNLSKFLIGHQLRTRKLGRTELSEGL